MSRKSNGEKLYRGSKDIQHLQSRQGSQAAGYCS